MHCLSVGHEALFDSYVLLTCLICFKKADLISSKEKLMSFVFSIICVCQPYKFKTEC